MSAMSIPTLVRYRPLLCYAQTTPHPRSLVCEHVPSKAPPPHANALGIHVWLCGKEFGRSNLIIHLLLSKVLVGGVQERLPSGRQCSGNAEHTTLTVSTHALHLHLLLLLLLPFSTPLLPSACAPAIDAGH